MKIVLSRPRGRWYTIAWGAYTQGLCAETRSASKKSSPPNRVPSGKSPEWNTAGMRNYRWTSGASAPRARRPRAGNSTHRRGIPGCSLRNRSRYSSALERHRGYPGPSGCRTTRQSWSPATDLDDAIIIQEGYYSLHRGADADIARASEASPPQGGRWMYRTSVKKRGDSVSSTTTISAAWPAFPQARTEAITRVRSSG